MKTKRACRLLMGLVLLLWCGSACPCFAGEAGEVLSVRQEVYLFRGEEKTKAEPQSRLYLDDTVQTERGARAKLFFTDDSILSLGQTSRLLVKEYMSASAEERPKSIMNLLEGSLKVVVGKSELEIHTPTVVAAARGTEFFLRVTGSGASAMTMIFVTRGSVEVRNVDLLISGVKTVYPGQMSEIAEGAPPTPPVPAGPEIRAEIQGETRVLGLPTNDRSVLAPDSLSPAAAGRPAGAKAALAENVQKTVEQVGGNPPIANQQPSPTLINRTPMKVRVEWK